MNGNLTRDDYRSLSLQYNSFNLPWEMDFGNNKKVSYFYDGSGRKLTMIVSTGTGAPLCTEYLGQFVHQYTMGGVSSLKYIITPEGRLRNKGTNAAPVWEWEYNLTDHLGNVRAVIRPGTGNMAEVMEYTNYFPFGMKMTPGLSQSSTDNRYLYNGKEQQTDFGLNWYDYGARMYDAVLGRWHSVDPLAELDYNFTPYHFCLNNPSNLVDPDGLSTHTDSTGVVVAVYNDGNNGVYKHGKLAENYATYEGETETYTDPETGETKTREKARLSGGENMGVTESWDEFREHDNKTGAVKTSIQERATIIFGESWDYAIDLNNRAANKMDLSDVLRRSFNGGQFDIKEKPVYAPHGPATGKLLNGKYSTARSAGNYLAGMNGATGRILGAHISLGTYMRLAGVLHSYQNGSSRTAPYYGEIPYAGKRIVAGFNTGVKKR